MIKCNTALMLFLFLSVSFINVAEARDVSSEEIYIYLADFEGVVDSIAESDPGDDSDGITYGFTEDLGLALNNLAVQAKTILYFDYPYLRPLTRAPPKIFI